MVMMAKNRFKQGVRKSKKEQRSLSKDELKIYLNTARKGLFRNYVMVKCYSYFGLRNNELRNLLIEDIHADHIIVRNAKGGKDRRIPIIDFRIDSEGISGTLTKWIGKRTAGYFLGENKGITDRQIRNIIKDIAKDAKIENYAEIHPHTLRHSFATILIQEGFNPYDVSKVMGHASVEMTKENYDHSYDKLRKDFDKERMKELFRKDLPELKEQALKEADTPMNRLLIRFIEAFI